VKIEPHEIPNSWEFTTMGEISIVIGGGTPKTKEPDNYEDGNMPWLTPADLSGYTQKTIGHGKRFITEKGLSTSSARMMPAGTVLYTSRAPIGYVVIASNPICTNQGFKSFVLNDGILPDYVYWYLKGTKDLAESFASGTTFLELSGASAKKLPIPIAPLNEQKLIVAEIEKQFSRLDEAIENLKRVKTNLKRYKASVLKAAVEGKLTEEWREKHPDVEPADKLLERILAERRKKWEEAELAKMKAKGKKPKNDKWKKKYKTPAVPLTSPRIPDLPSRWAFIRH
jgi:type I restriction enzyme, S subunit